jgi:hypothetical protein
MKRTTKITLAACGLALLIIGCTSSMTSTQPILASSSESDKGASQLWEENCNRCHNYRPASTYNDYQWTVVMRHMRVRANLTATEEKQILQFLQASN